VFEPNWQGLQQPSVQYRYDACLTCIVAKNSTRRKASEAALKESCCDTYATVLHQIFSQSFTRPFDKSAKLGFILKNRLMVFEPETKLGGGISPWQLRAL